MPILADRIIEFVSTAQTGDGFEYELEIFHNKTRHIKLENNGGDIFIYRTFEANAWGAPTLKLVPSPSKILTPNPPNDGVPVYYGNQFVLLLNLAIAITNLWLEESR